MTMRPMTTSITMLTTMLTTTNMTMLMSTSMSTDPSATMTTAAMTMPTSKRYHSRKREVITIRTITHMITQVIHILMITQVIHILTITLVIRMHTETSHTMWTLRIKSVCLRPTLSSKRS